MLSRATESRMCAQAGSLPFPDTAFDTVVRTDFLGVISPAIIAEMTRVRRREIAYPSPWPV